MQWDSLQLLEFVAMNHDHKNAALSIEEITDRYARDITPEGRKRIDLSELLAAINASHEDEANTSDDRTTETVLTMEMSSHCYILCAILS